MITVQANCRAKRIGHVSQALYYYRHHHSSITKAQGEEAHLARWNATKANTDIILDLLLKQYGFSEKDPVSLHLCTDDYFQLSHTRIQHTTETLPLLCIHSLWSALQTSGMGMGTKTSNGMPYSTIPGITWRSLLECQCTSYS